MDWKKTAWGSSQFPQPIRQLPQAPVLQHKSPPGWRVTLFGEESVPMRVKGKGPSSHLILHLNRARMAIDSRHVKMEDWAAWSSTVVPVHSQYMSQPAPGACSSPPCLVLPYTGANMLLLAGDAHWKREPTGTWHMTEQDESGHSWWAHWGWSFLVSTLRQWIEKMPGALAGMLRSSIPNAHKAPFQHLGLLKLLFIRAETLLLPRRTYIYMEMETSLGPDLQ